MISKNKIKYIHSLELKKNRIKDGVFVAEGHKLVGDLMPSFECVYIAATEKWIIQNNIELHEVYGTKSGKYDCFFNGKKISPKAIEFDIVTDDELKKISFVETPQHVLAVFKQKNSERTIKDVASKELCLALDDVQNPGNLGTILRIADWFGIEHVFCSKKCADVYNQKTVQATMGALSHVSVHYVELPEELASVEEDIPIYGTFLDGENIYSKQLKLHGVIVMGNEGNGISSDVEPFVDERLFIPNYPQGRATSESLNVAIATAVVCAEFRRLAVLGSK